MIIGPLLTMFDEKRLCHNLISNPIEKSIVWRLTPPEGMSQVNLCIYVWIIVMIP